MSELSRPLPAFLLNACWQIALVIYDVPTLPAEGAESDGARFAISAIDGRILGRGNRKRITSDDREPD
jgi:hypothetical protein